MQPPPESRVLDAIPSQTPSPVKYLLPLALLAAALTAHAQDLTRELGAFTALAVNSGIQATVQQSDRHRVVLAGDAEALAAVEIEYEGASLSLSFEDGAYGRLSAAQRSSVRATVYTKALERVVVNGGARVSSDVTWRTGFLRVVANGGGELDLRVEASDGVKLVANGGADVRLAGTTAEFSLNVNGGADVDASALDARRAEVMANGGAEAEVQAQERLKVMANGNSEVRYTGGVTDAEVRANGGSSVRRG